MLVKAETAAGNFRYKNTDYYFCSNGCLNKFRQTPEAFLNPNRVAEPMNDATAGVEYTFPMHPEIVQIGAGICPKCGMALDPLTFSLDDAPDPEYVDMKRRFWISAALTLPVFALAMAEMLPTFNSRIAPNLSLWMQFLLATPVVLYGGLPFFGRGWNSIINRSPNMFTLIPVGTGAAYLFSVAALFAPNIFPETMRDAHTNLIHAYFESAVITTLVLLGQVLELRARSQTSTAIKELLGLAPKTAEAVALKLGIDKVFADVLPDGKALKIKELQAQNKIVAMAGDGVNDAPALAQANVGIAMGTGTDVAIESADITLLHGDLNGILRARNLSRATMRNIRQNLFFAFIYNLVGVPVAAGALFPIFGILLSPMVASAAMTFSSFSVIMNALRLRNLKL